MEKIVKIITSSSTRMWCYNLMIAVMLYMTVRGYLKDDEAVALNAIAAAFFAVAMINTPHTPKHLKEEK